MIFKSIAMRFIILVIPVVFITIMLFVWLSYNISNSNINNQTNQKLQESLRIADLKIQLELYKNASVAINLANYASTLDADSFNHKNHKRYLENSIHFNENTFGGGVWFEPFKFDKELYHFGPFLYIDDKDNTIYVPKYGERVDYFKENWYIKGMESNGELVWSDVYYDPVSTKEMVTATMPFYNEEGTFLGVGTADMSFENIRNIVNNISVGSTGKAFIIGSNGEYISFFDEKKDIYEKMPTDSDETLAQLGKELLANDSGTTTLVRNGKKLRVYYMTMSGTKWTIAATFEENEINDSTFNSLVRITIIPIVGLVLVILSIFFITDYLRKIIRKVNTFADLAASGDFSKRIEVTENDEFGFMEQRLNKMISNMDDMSNHSAKLLKIAENASKSKGEFLSRMSHEIRTPINAIIGMTKIAKSSDDIEKIKNCLTKTETASKHLLGLINDILDMSKIEADKLELEEEEFSLEQALTNIYDMMLVKTEEKSQEFTLNINENVPSSIIGDELRFSQVVTNLVSNAAKFTPESGSICIDISEIEREGEYSIIRVCVKDSGIGLSEEQQAKLFRSFEQGDGSISRKFGGTGLGLVISKRIVELMGGNIWVTSELEKGSTFSFTIKALRGRGMLKQAEQTNNALPISDFSNHTILLVEDVDINREIVIAFLEYSNITICIAVNGVQAVEMFHSEPEKYDAILMDIQMPEMDGFEATRQIRQLALQRAKTIPIIAMTANVLSEDIKKCKEVGMDDHLAKPLEPQILLEKLSKYL